MEIDSWLNIHNEPSCVSIIDSKRNYTLVNTTEPYTAEYLQSISEKEIENCENNFKIFVGSFVTDNTVNVSKIRRNL